MTSSLSPARCTAVARWTAAPPLGAEWSTDRAMSEPPDDSRPPARGRTRPAHGPGRVGLRLPLEPVGRVGHAQARPVVGSGDGSLTLLDDVRQLMGEGVLVRSPVADDDVVAGGVGAGADLGGGRLRRGIGVDADIAEVRAEPAFHVGPGCVVERPASAAQDLVDGGALHRRSGGLPGLLLVAASGTVLMLFPRPGMPVPAEHLDDRLVPGRALQRGEALEPTLGPCHRRAWPYAPALDVCGPGIVSGTHDDLSACTGNPTSPGYALIDLEARHRGAARVGRRGKDPDDPLGKSLECPRSAS